MSPADLEISSDASRIDVDLVHRFLGTTYWAEGRPRDVVERSIANSLCFGGYISGRQVASIDAIFCAESETSRAILGKRSAGVSRVSSRIIGASSPARRSSEARSRASAAEA